MSVLEHQLRGEVVTGTLVTIITEYLAPSSYSDDRQGFSPERAYVYIGDAYVYVIHSHLVK